MTEEDALFYLQLGMAIFGWLVIFAAHLWYLHDLKKNGRSK